MKKLFGILFIFTSLIIAGCQPANVTAVKWDTTVTLLMLKHGVSKWT